MNNIRWKYVIGIALLSLGLTGCSQTTTSASQDKLASDKHSIEVPGTLGQEQAYLSSNDEDETLKQLVNKHHSLSKNDIPHDLVQIDVPKVLESREVNQLREEAAASLKELFAAAKLAGYELFARSGYRSYETQEVLFNNYVKQNGQEEANRYSAKAGHSEHQTGLVMDITSESVQYQLSDAFGETEEGKWVKEHAHEYGFIIRYPEGMEDITGYIYEPWHLRYLGVDLANKVYKSGLVYEEYVEQLNQGDQP